MADDKEALEAAIKILGHVFPENSGRYFICGEGGQKDEMGLPDRIHICPEYGSEIVVIYEKRETCKPME